MVFYSWKRYMEKLGTRLEMSGCKLGQLSNIAIKERLNYIKDISETEFEEDDDDDDDSVINEEENESPSP